MSTTDDRALTVRDATMADLAALCAIRRTPDLHGRTLEEVREGWARFLVAEVDRAPGRVRHGLPRASRSPAEISRAEAQ